MSSVECLREFVNERLSAAAEEIFGVFVKNIVAYEEEIDRQRRLLEIVWKPEIKLHRIELPQQHVCKEEEVLSDQQLCIQERSSSLDQEDPDPPQIKEEQEEPCTSQEGEQLEVQQETETFMLTPTYEESNHTEPEPTRDHRLLSNNSHVAESQDQKGSEHEDSESTSDSEPEPEQRHHENRSHCNDINNLLKTSSDPQTELPQQHVCKEEEVLSDQQLCIQERSSSLDQEDPDPPQIKEEQEEPCTSQEGEQLELQQETETFMLTPTDEESNHTEPEPTRDHRLLSNNSHVAESQDQKGSEHEDSESTRDSEPKKRHHENRSHCNDINNLLKTSSDPQTELPQQHVCKEEEVLSDQQLCIQERSSSLDQEDPDPPQIKEEQEEPCTSQEGEQLEVQQETETFMLTPTYEESNHTEPEPTRDHRLLSNNSHVAESQDQKGSEHEDSESTSDSEPKKRHHENRSHCNDINNLLKTSSDPQTELPQQHICKEEEVLSDQQLCIQERSSSLDQKDPDPPQMKEEQEEVELKQEGEQLELKQETETFMLTPTDEESNHTEPEPTRDHQLLSNNSHVAESQDQKGSEHEDSESTSDSEPEPKKRQHENRSHCNDINNLLKTSSDPQTGKALFQCGTCGEAFKFRSHFYKHLRTHSDEKSHSCSFCGKSFSKISSLKAHKKIHTSDKPHSCKTCGKDFRRSQHLIAHMRTHTGEKPYSCKTCGKDFQYRSYLIVHMRTHTGEKLFPCKTCGKDFRSNSHLIAHMITHTDEKPYSCKTCGKDFRSNSNLIEHMRTHTGDKPHSCKTCGKMFQYSCHLMVHMRTHTGEKPYSCKTCGKDFRRSNHLNSHMRTHTGKKSYSCKTCGQDFRYHSHLIEHMRTHTGEKPYSCKTCGKDFGRSSSLIVHMRIHTGEKPYSCKTCGKDFRCNSHLIEHMRTHR
ncbi:zinc finger protein 37-like [Cebidichthys violaceus]|uniref:zinc finger protein 37-like n=1 Tax=Cebidichthys violaceus TaxID=271503 RepID=UPI0035CBBF77